MKFLTKRSKPFESLKKFIQSNGLNLVKIKLFFVSSRNFEMNSLLRNSKNNIPECSNLLNQTFNEIFFWYEKKQTWFTEFILFSLLIFMYIKTCQRVLQFIKTVYCTNKNNNFLCEVKINHPMTPVKCKAMKFLNRNKINKLFWFIFQTQTKKQLYIH